MSDLQKQFGPIDIYLFDQLLKGRIAQDMRVLDAGCGGGRNLFYFLQQGYDVFAVDQDPLAIEEVSRLSTCLSPLLPLSNFRVAGVENLPFGDLYFDLVVSSAVLHFAQDDKQFQVMLHEMWRVLKVNGMLFCRLASSIGIEKKIKRLKGRMFLLPDGSERYLVDAASIEKLTHDLNAELLDPLKTTIVQNQRSMTTWVLRKTS